jgi:hypothetical protein
MCRCRHSQHTIAAGTRQHSAFCSTGRLGALAGSVLGAGVVGAATGGAVAVAAAAAALAGTPAVRVAWQASVTISLVAVHVD